MSDLLAMRPNDLLTDLMDRWEQIDAAAPVAEVMNVALGTVEFLKAKGQGVESPLGDLEEEWYASIASARTEPKWDVYDDPRYIGELFGCYVVYSRAYLKAITNAKGLPGIGSVKDELGEVKIVIDLGCGCGWTTAVLAQYWPEARVIGTNLRDTLQWDLATLYAAEYGFELMESVGEIETLNGAMPKVDFIFASEYFEHIRRPVRHIEEILTLVRPRALVMRNAFNARSIGHFDWYAHEQDWYAPPAISRLFNATMRQRGYERRETKFWNDRPYYWTLLA